MSPSPIPRLILGFALLTLAACTLGQSPPGQHLCTLVACGPSLEISLVGEFVPTVFSMLLESSVGDVVHVRCTDGAALYDPPEAARWSPGCPAGGVTLQDFTPTHFSVSLAWSEGDVTQVFEPAYTETRPNGVECEPACRFAALQLRIPAMPAYGDVSTWDTYVDEVHGFAIRHPAALTREFGPEIGGYRIVFVGDKIQIRTGPEDPLLCQGECPMIESAEPVTVADRQARLVRGYIGSIGGNIPQHFMLYLLRSGDTYISLTLFAESRHAAPIDPGLILPLHQADIEVFNRMVQTLEFRP